MGAAAHVRAGGHEISVGVLTVLVALLTIPVVRTSRSRATAGRAFLVLVAGQLLVHLAALVPGSGGVAGPGTVAAPVSGGHAAHAATAGALPDVVVQGGHLGLHPGMLAGHVVVAAMLALGWARGEEILFAVVDRVAPPTAPRVALPGCVALLAVLATPARSIGGAALPARGPPLS